MCGQNECGHGSCSNGYEAKCSPSGGECGSSCECSNGSSCPDANSCSNEGGCEDEDWAAAKAYKYYYKAKKKLIVKKIMERLEKEQGKKLDALAEAIISYVKDEEAAEEKEDRKAEGLKEKMDEAFEE